MFAKDSSIITFSAACCILRPCSSVPVAKNVSLPFKLWNLLWASARSTVYYDEINTYLIS